MLRLSLSVYLCIFHPHNEHKALEMLSAPALALVMIKKRILQNLEQFSADTHATQWTVSDGFWQHDIEKVCTYL